MSRLIEQGKKAKEVARTIGQLSSQDKNRGLTSAADNLIARMDEIVEANKKDVSSAIDQGITGALVDRLTLDKNRIEVMVEGIRQIVKLDDPVGEVSEMKKRPNGLVIGQKRVPLGVVGIIYEARPNVTADAFALCLKSGNATILRGGKEAIGSNMKIVEIIGEGLESAGIPKEAIQLVEDTSREISVEMMKMNDYLDVLIPRGGKGLIRSVIENSTVPVIETGEGNCHVYIDQSADMEKAIAIVINAKTHRPGVCNAMETLIIHKDMAQDVLPELVKKLQSLRVEVRGDEKVKQITPNITLAVEEDWATEYQDYILAIKIVEDFEEATDHIATYGTGHSEAIVTESYTRAQKFLDVVDAAAVYVNASTRFTDGSEFGFGAEIGISTQKLHARGPMGLRELTTSKYIIYGDGQIRQ
ncbi:MAG TPA: glutamate-5-semialdehyde dehydrogenase [Epulopiscium sp.]|nr:glutamate-5-semialdehyde dehydrogenase [Candidatus Epulonipiscium sp.]